MVTTPTARAAIQGSPVRADYGPVPLDVVKVLEQLGDLATAGSVKGMFASQADLPTGADGDYAIVLGDPGAGAGVYSHDGTSWTRVSANSPLFQTDRTIETLREGSGIIDPVGTTTDLSTATSEGAQSGAFNIVFQSRIARDSIVKTLTVKADAGGTIVFYVVTVQDSTATVVRRSEHTVTTGVNTITLNYQVPAGVYLGISGNGVLSDIGSGGPHWVGGNGTNLVNFTISGTENTQEWGARFDIDAVLGAVPSKSAPGAAGFYPAGDLAAEHHAFLAFNGQSNSVGVVPAITIAQEFDAKGFTNNDDTIVDLVSPTAGNLEFPGYGAARFYRDMLLANNGSVPDDRSVVTVGRAGASGLRIDEVNQGTSSYNNMIDQLTAAFNAATAASADFVTLGMAFIQGEADAAAGTSFSAYRSALGTLGTNWRDDAQAVTSETTDPRTFLAQVSHANGMAGVSGDDGFDICRAQQDAGVAFDDRISCVCPTYQLPFSDDRHPTAEGYRALGAYLARAAYIFKASGDKSRYKGLQIIGTKIEGDEIVLFYNKVGLKADVTLVAPQDDYGYIVKNGGATVQITSISMQSNEVRLTCASTPATGWTVTYGESSVTNMSPYVGGAGNIRDEAGSSDQIDGFPLHHWALLQEVTI